MSELVLLSSVSCSSQYFELKERVLDLFDLYPVGRKIGNNLGLRLAPKVEGDLGGLSLLWNLFLPLDK